MRPVCTRFGRARGTVFPIGINLTRELITRRGEEKALYSQSAIVLSSDHCFAKNVGNNNRPDIYLPEYLEVHLIS